MNSVFITVEGPIGVGKTSLARAISQHFGYQLLEEIVYENPFLGKFYENLEEWSFQLEMFFLCNRYKQLQDIHTRYLQQGTSVVSDYNIFKNMIFAKRTLDSGNLPKFLQIYDILTGDMPQAHLVLYLKATIDTVMGRIKMRGREIEQKISRAYMEQLIADYDEFMRELQVRHPDLILLTLPCDDLDYVHSAHDLDYVLGEIAKRLNTILETRS